MLWKGWLKSKETVTLLLLSLMLVFFLLNRRRKIRVFCSTIIIFCICIRGRKVNIYDFTAQKPLVWILSECRDVWKMLSLVIRLQSWNGSLLQVMFPCWDGELYVTDDVKSFYNVGDRCSSWSQFSLNNFLIVLNIGNHLLRYGKKIKPMWILELFLFFMG